MPYLHKRLPHRTRDKRTIMKLRFAVMIYQHNDLWFGSVKDKNTDLTLHTTKGYVDPDMCVMALWELIDRHLGKVKSE